MPRDCRQAPRAAAASARVAWAVPAHSRAVVAVDCPEVGAVPAARGVTVAHSPVARAVVHSRRARADNHRVAAAVGVVVLMQGWTRAGRPGGEGGGMAFAGAHTWEYKFVDLTTDDRASFVKAITDAGKDGWEYCGSERLRVAGDRMPLVLVFKKQKGGAGAIFGGMGMPGGGGAFGGGGLAAGMPGAGGGGLGGVFGGGDGRGRMDIQGMGAFSGLMSGGGRDIDAKTFKLKNAASGDVVGAVEKAFPKAKMLKVIGEPFSNTVIVVADPTTIKEATKLIEELDGKPKAGASGPGDAGPRGGGGRGPTGGPSAGGPMGGLTGGGGPPRGGPPMGAGTGGDARAGGLTVYSLKNASADELAAVLKKVFPTAEITAESRTNQLIVRIGEKDAADFEKLIQRLDTK